MALKPQLMPEQAELVGQFDDASYEYSSLDFEAVAAKVGARFFDTPEGRLFKRECNAIFDRERQK